MEKDPFMKQMNGERPPMPEVTVVAVTDLGSGNAGTINAADISPETRTRLPEEITKPEYRKAPTNRFRCIDGCTPKDGLVTPEGMADPGIAGGEAVTGAAADMMLTDGLPVSILLKQNVADVIGAGRPVVVHGDDVKGTAGCGAMVQLVTGEVFKANAENRTVVADKSWTIAGLIGLDKYLYASAPGKMIDRGAEKVGNTALFDISPEVAVDTTREMGAEYEELVRPHNEKVINVDVSETAFDEAAFMADHPTGGAPLQVFVASIKLYANTVFADYAAQGRTETEAAEKVLAAIIFNVGVSKQLTAEEAGQGEALPVVITQ